MPAFISYADVSASEGTMKRLRIAVSFAAVAALVVGCNRRQGPAAPSPVPSVTQPVTPPSTGVPLAGTVNDAAWRRVVGAKVEVVDGPHAGMSTVTDSRGEYRLTGTFDESTHFRASKDGYVAAISPFPARCAPCNPNWWVHFYLETTAAHPILSGTYTLTFAAASNCTALPSAALTRSYPVVVAPVTYADAPANSQFTVTMTGSSFVEPFSRFDIGVAGNYMAAEMGNAHGSPGLVEQVGANTYLTFTGGIEGTVSDPSRISASFNGLVDQCELTGEWGSRYACPSGDTVARAQCNGQGVTLVRR
jgi:hypothetical protein